MESIPLFGKATNRMTFRANLLSLVKPSAVIYTQQLYEIMLPCLD